MGWLSRFRNKQDVTVTRYQMITDVGNGFFSWNGNLYQSDIVRAAIRPKAVAIGKTVAKHIRNGSVNPDVYMRFLLEEPNPIMTMQMFLEKMVTHLELNNNAFAYIERDPNGFPIALYPIAALSAEAIQDKSGELYLKFNLRNQKPVTFRYSDVIHLRKDFNSNEIFGDQSTEVLAPLMEIITTTDQGIVKAIKNSNIIKWLLKFNQTLRPEDLRANTKEFVTQFLNVETSETSGAAATDAKMDAQQVEPKDYVPNEKQSEITLKRVYSFYNTSEKIIQGNYSENEWVSYYESAIEPTVLQISNEFSRKLFSRRERGFGNKIVFESSNLTFASMQTKLQLVNYVDRGIMVPNEVRAILNMAPIEGGDIPIRRLDTRPTTE